MNIEDFVPEVGQGIDKIGFLFGAGTSFEAGYPLISGLTKQVFQELESDERDLLSSILEQQSLAYDQELGTPNIEEIADFVTARQVNADCPQSKRLLDKIRKLIREAILGVTTPNISDHVAFFEALKVRAFDRPTDIFIITTNYDLLFEEAASYAGVRMNNGFVGTTFRYFSEAEFGLSYGTLSGQKFQKESGLRVHLYKLHGSISWFKDGSEIREVDPLRIQAQHERCMILPRRSKIIETLHNPHDRLFRRCSELIGRDCKFLISNGFSFGDDHINSHLITPKISNGSIRITNFCEFEPSALSAVRDRPNVIHQCSDKKVHRGIETPGGSTAWQFGNFTRLF
ncbi:SIR2 family protein [Ponticaulis profundi]|uniref:SIR2 family protein n=1 Tax=Ponticaulis profundi TaxID=2665222 RepID=A0ABW1S7D6_9PROT